MKKSFVWSKVVVATFIVLIIPLVAFAQNPCKVQEGSDSSLGACVSQVYIWAMGAAAFLGIIMGVVGGYLVMTSSGNAAQAAKGKSFLYSALIGIGILMAAYLILTTINPDLTRFNVNLDPATVPPPPPRSAN